MAVGCMMDILQIRRGMLDPLTLPNSKVCHPEDGILIIEVCRFELGMRADRKPVVRNVLSSLHENMTPTMSKMAQHTGRGSVTGSSGMMIHPGMYRRAMLIGTDVRKQILTHPSVRCMKLLGDMEAMYNVMKSDGYHSDKGKKTVTTADVELGQPPEFQEAEKQRPETAAAIAEMNRVALNDHTGGLHWYFYHTRPTDEFSFPSDRLEILRYAVNKSLKYACTLAMTLRCQQKQERLTIKAISTVADLRTLSIKSSHKAPEREDAINQINSPDSKADVLITSGRLSAFGVNYHNTFQNDILLKATENTATEIQMEGRLWRIGQSHCPVRSPSSGPFLVVQSIPPCPCSLSEYQQLRKVAEIVVARAPIDRRIEGEQLTICAFEIMATYLGYLCNRHPRKGAEWYNYDSQKMTDLGELYSAIARTMILRPDRFCNMTPQFSRELAVS
ncbi:hypothetical protein BN1723_003831 [Verticillium longisporum]|uniref:Helicase C-terminal domain-containing protein n=1 Tax=Verticillium longisporum TaxID=100787 RepID=A0A0G4MCZ7_VERLO|nr:hypothetical protein BN1723_003831 [Verticillium longisporum]